MQMAMPIIPVITLVLMTATVTKVQKLKVKKVKTKLKMMMIRLTVIITHRTIVLTLMTLMTLMTLRLAMIQKQIPSASTGTQATTKNVARIWVSFQEEGQAIEGELIVSPDKKPSDKNSAIVLIDGLLNELPLEELTFVRISY